MTAKEKAEELHVEYWHLTNDTRLAKQCAIITVDEIIESKKLEYLFTFQEITLLNFTKDDRLVHSKFINYWKEVKQELENI